MTLTETDILDEVDALLDAGPECEICGEPSALLDAYEWCPSCRDCEDPSPMCNCGTCSPGDYTCIRKD